MPPSPDVHTHCHNPHDNYQHIQCHENLRSHGGLFGFLDFSARWRQKASFMLKLLYPFVSITQETARLQQQIQHSTEDNIPLHDVPNP